MTYFDRYFAEKFSKVELRRDQLKRYQSEIALPFLKDNPFSALFVDMGLGKTATTLTLISDLLDKFEFEKALIIGPLRVVNTTWPDEIMKWEHVAHLTWYHIRDDFVQEIVRKAGADVRAPIVEQARREAESRGIDLDLEPSAVRAVVNEFVKLRNNEIRRARVLAARKAIRKADKENPATIHLIHREQVEFLVDAWGKDWPYDVVIIDESSGFKDHKTRRFKALKRVRPLIKRMHQLTATPATEGYMGLFAQMYLLDQGERLGLNITSYRDRYFTRGYDGFSWNLRPGGADDIAAKISDICLTLKKEDYLPEMSEPVFNPRYVDLTPEEMKLYKKFQKEFVLELPGGAEIEAETAANLSGKLMQLASGCVYDDEKVVHEFHNHKIEELRNIVDEVGGKPLLVAYWFQSSLNRLKRAFPSAVVMDSDGKAVAPWNRGEIPMLLMHPQGAGHGLNLQKGGHHLVFFDIPWSLELYIQTVGRLDRQGQEELVILHHIIARDTIEEYVVKCLKEKRVVQDELFRMLKVLRRSAAG